MILVVIILSCNDTKEKLTVENAIGIYRNMDNPHRIILLDKEFKYYYSDSTKKFSGDWFISDPKKYEICFKNWKPIFKKDSLISGTNNSNYIFCYDNGLIFSPDNAKYNFVKDDSQ